MQDFTRVFLEIVFCISGACAARNRYFPTIQKGEQIFYTVHRFFLVNQGFAYYNIFIPGFGPVTHFLQRKVRSFDRFYWRFYC